MKVQNSQRGFTALFVTVLIFSAVFAISASIFILTYGEQKIAYNIVKSSQAYYAAESGLEDALLRLVKKLSWSSPYKLNAGDNWATTTISNIIGGSRTITAQGNALDRVRKVQASYEISADSISFHYGAQVGEGGIIMDNGSAISGNVFSNGSIIAQPNTEITGTVKVAKTGNKIDGARVGQDAFVDICLDSAITGTLTSAVNTNCTAANTQPLEGEIAATSFAITQEQISQWKNEAAAGGTIIGSYVLQGQQQDFLGPKKIEGNLTIKDKAKLFATGALWVTGAITVQNTAEVRLDQPSYGSLSGMIISDGLITLQDSAKALGSGQGGSYLLLISASPQNPAIKIQNSFEADILFAAAGWIEIQDSAEVREITGYGIHLKNNAEINYEVGLQDASFSSGPGGSWEVTSWGETE